MSYKESLVYAPRSFSYTISDSGGNSYTTDWDRSPVIGKNTVVMEDTAYPDWKHRIANGQCATTTLSGQRVGVETQQSDFSLLFQYNTDTPQPWSFTRYTLSGPFMALVPPASIGDAPSLLPLARDRAIMKFYQNLAGTRASFKGMVFAGELKESLMMIRRPAVALREGVGDYLRTIKRWADGRTSTRREKQSFVRDTWLEYSFGWKPLISDIEDGTVAFLKSQWARPIQKMVRGNAEASTSAPYSYGNQFTMGDGYYISWDVDINASAQVKYYGVIRSEGDGPSTASYYGFNPYEFVPTLWELIPYSFLVDYFTNIGEFVSAWSYRNIGAPWVSEGYKLDNRLKTVNIGHKYLGFQVPPHKPNPTGSPGSSSAFREVVLRTPTITLFLPDLRLQCPGVGSTRWINIAALSTQLSATRRSLAR